MMLLKRYMLFLSVFSTVPVMCQITTRQIADRVEDPIPQYDSLDFHINMNNYKELIGQTLFVLPKSKLYRWQGGISYNGFSILPEDAGGSKSVLYRPVMWDKYNYCSDSSALAGKYFDILSFIDKTDNDGKYKTYEMGLYIKIENQETHDTLYYQLGKLAGHVNDNEHAMYPFIITGYYEKLKKLNVGKIFIAQEDIAELNDINNGKPLSCEEGSEWTCKQVTLTETKGGIYWEPIFIFQDSNSNEIAVGMRRIVDGIPAAISEFRSKEVVMAEEAQQDEDLRKQIAEEKKAKEQSAVQAKKNAEASAAAKRQRRENLIKKYGEKQAAMILEGHVAIGMTKEMCIDAWGRPRDVNTTTGSFGVHEQWVYNMKSYLYFENGLLTTIQN